MLLLNMVLPLLALVWASLTPYLQIPSVSAFQMVSLENFGWCPGLNS